MRFHGLFGALVIVALASCTSAKDDADDRDATGGAGGSSAGDSGSGGTNGGSGSGGEAARGGMGGGGAGNGGTTAGGGFAGTTAGGAGAVGGSGEPGTRKRIFVTAGAFPGNFYRSAGGLEAGDAQCNLSAATLGGVWRAWLSSSSVDAIDRIEDVGPWYLVDRTTLVFDDAAQMATGPSAPIDMSEDGERLPAKSVWTGTAPAGTGASDTCSDWSSDRATVEGQVGRSNLTGATWTTSTVESCGLYAGLYCIEQ